MEWRVEAHGAAVVVEMRSNPVNKMNPQFFDDLHAALDLVEQRHPGLPLVLTGAGSTFSAGLDFEDVFPRFARGQLDEVTAWFERFRGSILRVFALPRRTVAAVNGHAVAGGLILALCCDVRIGAAGPARFGLNEVPIGIPMPGVYTEIVRYAVGSRAAAESILEGRLNDVDQALRLGYLHEVVPGERLIAEALARAQAISPDSCSAYAVSKQALLQPALKRIAGDAREMDERAVRVVVSPDSMRAQAAALDLLKRRSSRSS